MLIPEDKAPFYIKNDSEANWAFRKLAEARKEIKTIQAKKVKYDEDNADWLEKEIKKPKDSEAYFEEILEEYRRSKTDGKLSTPAGQAKKRHITQYEYDSNELLKYLKENQPQLVKTEEKPQWGEFKKTLLPKDNGRTYSKETGEEIPFVKAFEKETITFKTED